MRILILGGTTEASVLAQALAHRRDLRPILSLAGRTERPAHQPIPVRVGGFGGAAGLVSFLRSEAIAAVVDATHPFAAKISASAAEACVWTGVPLAVFTRPAWRPEAADRWIEVADLAGAADALGSAPLRVFLTVGRLGLAAFRRADQHRYLVRTIDPPEAADLPADHRLLLARGPFAVADEKRLLQQHEIQIVVTKNSGGKASAAKLAAARALGLPVVVVERPAAPGGIERLASLDAVLAWIEAHRPAP